MKAEDVGKLFTTNGEDVWKMIWYCSYPTYGMKNLQTSEEIRGSVGCYKDEPYIKLIPEKEIVKGE